MVRSLCITLFSSLLLAPLAYSQPGTVKLTAPWSSEGTLYQVSPDGWIHLGVLQGVVYIEGSSDFLDKADFTCPTLLTFYAASTQLEGVGHCIFKTEGETVYGQWRCSGTIGLCDGTFTLTGGTGRRERIHGEGPLKLHLTTSNLIPRGSLRRFAAEGMATSLEGLAELPALSYRFHPPFCQTCSFLPKQEQS